MAIANWVTCPFCAAGNRRGALICRACIRWLERPFSLTDPDAIKDLERKQLRDGLLVLGTIGAFITGLAVGLFAGSWAAGVGAFLILLLLLVFWHQGG